ncbi:MAG: hypothetical protein ACLQVI_03675 [Polyangiaceae bacterium]|jgi:chemotaxis protein histidine kinase CheA
MTAKRRATKTAAKRSTKRDTEPTPTLAESAPASEPVVDLARELREVQGRIDILAQLVGASRDGSTASARLRELAESLQRTVDEVRRGKLDRTKLLAIASAVAAISRILSEALAVSEK